MAGIKVDEYDPIGELEPSFPFRDVKILHNVDVRDYYDLKEEIGRGKFGTVYRCVEKKSGTVLAAKFVAIAKKQDRINVEREVEIMRTLQHPRLIQLYDSFEIRNVMCVVLELIQGGELFERVIDDDFILTEKACSVFMRQICEGVNFIHANKIIHLDLKPENILCLTKTGNRIKIIDFGLARKYDPNKKLQVLFGTPEFVAPEVVNFDEITSATDMWSVGVICYVLLSGLSPFMGENDLQTMTNVTMAQYDYDDEAFDNISADAKDFISRLLVKSKEKRLNAMGCINHPWLKRKPPPPPMLLEQSKENLKTYVDNNHSSSPFLLASCLSNGAINNIQLPPVITEKAKIKAETPEKILKPIERTPEIPPAVSEPGPLLLNEQNVKLKNDINLEKSTKPNIIIKEESSIGNSVKSLPVPEINVLLNNVKNEDNEIIVQPQMVIKTDSYNDIQRKFSLTISGGSRELPRRSSLSRSDKAKNEIKRETYVTFVGPLDIKQMDPEEKSPVDELTNFIKSSIKESSKDLSDTQIKKDDVQAAEGKTIFMKSNKEEPIGKSVDLLQKKEEELSQSCMELLKDGSIEKGKYSQRREEVSSIKLMTTKLSSTTKKSDGFLHKTKESLEKKDEITPLLRPTDCLKNLNKQRETVHDYTSPLENKLFDSNKYRENISSSTITMKTSTKQPYQNILSSFTSKDVTSSNTPKIPSTLNAKDALYSSPRNLSRLELSKKQTDTVIKKGAIFTHSGSVDNDRFSSKYKPNENATIKPWHTNPIKNDLTLPRKSTQSSKLQETVTSTKESTSGNIEESRIRATSLDPTPAYSSVGNNEHTFQSRFLKSSLFKSESSFKAPETASSKYEEFRSRYSNYKELALDNNKLFRKSYVERSLPRKSELDANNDKPCDTPTGSSQSGENASQSSSSTTNQSSTSHSLNPVGIMSRQKFKLTDPQRDVPTSYNKSNISSSLSSYKVDRYTSSISSLKNSISLKSSQSLSQNSDSNKSKHTLPEKCPTNPQKSL